MYWMDMYAVHVLIEHVFGTWPVGNIILWAERKPGQEDKIVFEFLSFLGEKLAVDRRVFTCLRDGYQRS